MSIDKFSNLYELELLVKFNTEIIAKKSYWNETNILHKYFKGLF